MARLGRLEQGERTGAEAGMERIQGGKDVAPEARAVVVGRHPARPRPRARPAIAVAEQGGLAEAGRGDEQRERTVQSRTVPRSTSRGRGTWDGRRGGTNSLVVRSAVATASVSSAAGSLIVAGGGTVASWRAAERAHPDRRPVTRGCRLAGAAPTSDPTSMANPMLRARRMTVGAATGGRPACPLLIARSDPHARLHLLKPATPNPPPQGRACARP